MLKALIGAGLLAAAIAIPAPAATVTIDRCYDGDTCTSKAGEKIRLACFDTPELRGRNADPEPAKLARDFLRRLVVDRTVEIQRHTRDRYGRTVADLFIPIGTARVPVGALMVDAGHGVIVGRYAHQCAWAQPAD